MVIIMGMIDCIIFFFVQQIFCSVIIDFVFIGKYYLNSVRYLVCLYYS